jgi:hypothetical protein
MLLGILSVAVGLSAINPQSAEPVGNVPLFTGIATAISLIISAFVGGYVAARISGLTRRSDGVSHGLVSWGVSTIVFAYLITTSMGSVLGGTMNVLGQGAKAAIGGAAGATAGVSQSPSAQSGLETLLKGAGGGNITPESMTTLQQQLSAGDRNGAINTMVSDMGFTRDRATTLVDKGMALYGQAPEKAREIATSAVSGLTAASWSLFIGLLLSLGLSILGGILGSRSALTRRTALAAVR